MPLYRFWCPCGHKWEIFRHIQDEVPEKERCPNCREIGRREYQARINEFTPYWTDGLTGRWEYIGSKNQEVERERATGMVRLPTRGSVRLSQPIEMEKRHGVRGN